MADRVGLHIFFCIFFVLASSQLGYGGLRKLCADFNHGAARAVAAGLYDPFICPRDGIAGTYCKSPFPLRNATEVFQSNLQWETILMYMLVGKNSKIDAFLWWVQFVTEPIDLVLVADACEANVKNFKTENCTDSTDALQDRIRTQQPLMRVHIVRTEPVDAGYRILSCKLRRGNSLIYKAFPHKRYFFKIDTDTIIFPRRLMRFINTLDSVVPVEQQPVYFGTVVESGGSQLLCRHEHAQDSTWHFREFDERGSDICYAQGGAGYGLNNIAMRQVAASGQCELGHQSTMPEDLFTALTVFNDFNESVVIHCGAFRSSELVSHDLFRHSISFHYIDAQWLTEHGKSLISHYDRSSSRKLSS